MVESRGWSRVRYWVGFDVGKAFHWACVLDEEDGIVLSRRVEATEQDLEAVCSEIEALGGERGFGIDLLGGPATLLEAVLLARGERVFHLPGMAVNRARDGYRGEHKSDREDARVIADQLRMRWRPLREVRAQDEASAELRALVSHRRGLVEDQARLITRLRALLLEVFPGLEAALDARLGELVAERPEAEVVRSMPGMGPLFTAEFLAEVGDLSRFASADSLAAAAGLKPATRQPVARSNRTPGRSEATQARPYRKRVRPKSPGGDPKGL